MTSLSTACATRPSTSATPSTTTGSKCCAARRRCCSAAAPPAARSTRSTNNRCWPATAPTLASFSDATILRYGNPQPKTQGFENLILQSDHSGHFRGFGLKHQITAGIDANVENFTNFAVGAAATKPRSSSENRSFDAKALGVYGQGLVQIAPDWKLLAGLRRDQLSGTHDTLQFTGATATTGSVTAPSPRARGDSLWRHRLGALYQPTPFQSWHVSYGSSFNT